MNRLPTSLLRAINMIAMLGCSIAFAQVPQDGLSVVDLEEQAIRAATKAAAPWVLKIETLGGLEAVGQQLVTQGPTTGVVITPDGFIVSSAFSFVQIPSSILVTLPDGKRRAAKLVARDRSRMLVLLKVATDEPLQVPTTVDRSELQVGQTAIGLGRTYPGALPSVSAGIVSAINRIWGRAVQTDVKVSPVNYGGPLIDLQGRLIGILVPLSPQQQSEVAGAEWYDSGIGFASSLTGFMKHLDELKAGTDLHQGLLGISLKGTNIYEGKVEIAAVAPKSPAADAGFKSGDVIVEVDGQPVVRQAQLKHALGPQYAGDSIRVVVERDEPAKRHTLNAKLAKEILPYAHPFFGVLPDRRPGNPADGVRVRAVYPDSAATIAQIKPGDFIVKLGDNTIQSVDDAHEALLPYEPGAQIQATIRRAGKVAPVDVTLSAIPTKVPTSLGPAATAKASEDEIETGAIEINIPEESNKCHAWVPENAAANIAHGVLIWLADAGDFEPKSLQEDWGVLCERYHFIVVSPRPNNAQRWMATDVDFIHKVTEEVMSRYSVDPHRVVIGGQQTGAAIGFMAAFPRRDLIRGVVAIDAALPRAARVPANEPAQRFAAHFLVTEGSRITAAVDRSADRLSKMKYPVSVQRRNQTGKELKPEHRAELIRWADSLDRF